MATPVHGYVMQRKYESVKLITRQTGAVPGGNDDVELTSTWS
ncbi:hypothetical protein [Paractinoplanes ferrugineus]|nr:hypothetical protein [Actinoplanes ferrugineus]